MSLFFDSNDVTCIMVSTKREKSFTTTKTMKKEKYIKRKPGSCRFSPYYKLEYFDNKICAWKPKQVRYYTIEDALKNTKPNGKWRVYKVTETGRELV